MLHEVSKTKKNIIVVALAQSNKVQLEKQTQLVLSRTGRSSGEEGRVCAESHARHCKRT